MEDFTALVLDAQTGNLDAFNDLVRRFQDMAVGYAYAMLRDFQFAEDAAQEAFLDAYRLLNQLREPEAFPSWFRRVIFKQCDRITRAMRDELRPLETMVELPSDAEEPLETLADRERKGFVVDAIAKLPEKQREATTLFYLSDYSQKEIADFLGVSATTVNSRLQSARNRLKSTLSPDLIGERMITMVKDTLHENAPSSDDSFVNVVGLCNAAQAGDLEKVKQIIKVDSSLVKAEHPQHLRKPLDYAVREGHVEIVRVLLKAGADALFYSFYWHRDRARPLVLARERGHTEIVEVIEAWVTQARDATPIGNELRQAIDDGQTERVREILDANPKAVNDKAIERGATPLHHALRTDNWRLVQELIERGADVNVPDIDNFRPLHVAEDRLMRGILLAKGAECDISIAAALGDVKLVREMLEGDPELANYNHTKETTKKGDWYPLSIAAGNGKRELVELLLDHDADPNTTMQTNWDDGTYVETGHALIGAIQNKHWDVAHLLLDRGTRADSSPIYAAASVADVAALSGNEELMNRIFLMGGCPIVHYLFDAKQYLLIRQLIDRAEAGIPYNSPGDGGDVGIGRIFHIAIRWGDVDVIKICLEKKPKLVKDVTIKTMWELLRSFKRRNLDAYALLLGSGVDVHIRGPEDTTLLHWVAAAGSPTDDELAQFAKILIEHGIDINAKDDELKSTALGWAARYGRKPLVEYLLERGAATNLPDDEPWATPLAWAEKKGHTEIAELLSKHGATK